MFTVILCHMSSITAIIENRESLITVVFQLLSPSPLLPLFVIVIIMTIAILLLPLLLLLLVILHCRSLFEKPSPDSRQRLLARRSRRQTRQIFTEKHRWQRQRLHCSEAYLQCSCAYRVKGFILRTVGIRPESPRSFLP